MSERICICGHETTMGRCWRLTCPENGGSSRTLERARPGEFYRKGKDKLL